MFYQQVRLHSSSKLLVTRNFRRTTEMRRISANISGCWRVHQRTPFFVHEEPRAKPKTRGGDRRRQEPKRPKISRIGKDRRWEPLPKIFNFRTRSGGCRLPGGGLGRRRPSANGKLLSYVPLGRCTLNYLKERNTEIGAAHQSC